MTTSAPPGIGWHSIAAVERDTGLAKDTLRVWERRYGFPAPGRDAQGERLYSDDDLVRLRHIRRLAMRLANRLRTACPKCAAPGFGEPLPRPGLPCATCGFPTSMPSGPAWQCQACHHIEHRKVKGKADPAFCPMCNR